MNINEKISQRTIIIEFYKNELKKYGIDVNQYNYSIMYDYWPKGAVYKETKNHKQKVAYMVTDNIYAIGLLNGYYDYLLNYASISRKRK